MPDHEWFQTHKGLWWWPATGTRGLIEWLGNHPTRYKVDNRLCVIPESAPLLDGLTPVATCRVFCALRRITASHELIRTRLRQLEVPDEVHEKSVRYLTLVHRVQTWLAMASLVPVEAVILAEALPGAPIRHHRQISRLLQEAAATHRHIFVVTPHQESAAALGAFQKPPVDDLER